MKATNILTSYYLYSYSESVEHSSYGLVFMRSYREKRKDTADIPIMV